MQNVGLVQYGMSSLPAEEALTRWWKCYQYQNQVYMMTHVMSMHPTKENYQVMGKRESGAKNSSAMPILPSLTFGFVQSFDLGRIAHTGRHCSRLRSWCARIKAGCPPISKATISLELRFLRIHSIHVTS